ncbi:AI-2E family transporter [Natrinema salaciae]|uniref:Predicted PurR-regulated permease PerM n=1 Tax=Natrinema salaciae TaxID=1186196 RepID=A0A1H9ANY4_9EURY|nr:AI-2E family transporter [Natrinema salaciae]SEP78177.1 Predicted PurR-regulated permease PerM [Natrinema salaciae]
MNARTAFLALLVSALCALAAMMVLPLLEYVLAACLLAVVLRPAYERLEPRVGPRVAGLTCTGLAVVGGIVPLLLISIVVARTAASVLESFDADRIVATGRDVARNDLGMADETVTALETAVRSELVGSIPGAAELTLTRTVGVVATGMEVAVGVFVVVFLVYYLLIDGPAALGWIREVAPLDATVLDELFEEVHAVTVAVLRSHVFVALVQGVLGGLGLALLGVPYATTLAIVLVFASFLPTIGVWLVWGPVTIAHATSSNPIRAAILLGYGIAVLAVADSYLRAILVDRGSSLHPATALVGVVGGISLFGIVGLFVGPVVIAAFKACVTVVDRIDRADRDEPEPGIERERPVVKTER